MTFEQIDDRIAVLVKTERHTTRETLELIRHAESIRLPENLGYRNTHHWLLERHKYSGSAADRRIQAARLLRDLPHIAEKVEDGAVNLSILCKMQTVLRAQQKATGQKPSLDQKREAITQIENKSCGQAEQVLHTLFPEAEVSNEKTVHKRDGGERLTVELSAQAVGYLERAREILSHALPSATIGDLIERIARDFVENNDPLIKAERKIDQKKSKNAAGEKAPDAASELSESSMTHADLTAVAQRKLAQRRRPALPTALRREVIRRAGARCEYRHQTRRRESRYQIEVDHVVPKAKGGTDTLENLRCLCRKHNQMVAEREYGREFMQMKRRHANS
jgi:5-methylcytosine-specific restriction endonuclease McrA